MSKEEIIDLVLKSQPNHHVQNTDLIKRAGYWQHGIAEFWAWRINVLKELSKYQLAKIVLLCKHSWE